MKGLLIKDYKLLMLQKKTFLLMLLIAICMNFAMQDNPGFIIGYLTFFAALMANTTLSYDEYGNGIIFLLTLPVTRKTYVKQICGKSVIAPDFLACKCCTGSSFVYSTGHAVFHNRDDDRRMFHSPMFSYFCRFYDTACPSFRAGKRKAGMGSGRWPDFCDNSSSESPVRSRQTGSVETDVW